MKRIAYAGATLLLAFMVGVPISHAETSEPKAEAKAVSMPEMSAFDLASLAYRGAFREQGIPSYATLSEAHRAGRIRAKDIVTAAIQTKRLPQEALTNRSLLNAIDANLQSLDPRR